MDQETVVSIPQIVLEGDEARARRSDPIESHMAADSISREAREASELEVIAILAGETRPVITEQIIRRNAYRATQGLAARSWTPERIRTALNQLMKKGRVVQDGTGVTSRGRQARAWRLT